MEVINISLDDIKKLNNLSICLGYFDAFHIGHIALIKKAKELDGKIALLTMEPNPKSFFGDKTSECIKSVDDKMLILDQLGIDYFIILKTEKRLLDLPAELFIEDILVPLGAKNVICGYDYTFGINRSGNPDLLRALSKNRFDVYEVNAVVNNNGVKISSSLIHSLIKEGNVKEANEYLYDPYKVKGKVVIGNQLGNKIGFPTANIDLKDNYLLPMNGVYSGYAIVDGIKYLAMINVGTHPTIKELKNRLIEAHILDFDKDIYGKEIVVGFNYFLRPEKRFNSLEDLKHQLEIDKTKIRETN